MKLTHAPESTSAGILYFEISIFTQPFSKVHSIFCPLKSASLYLSLEDLLLPLDSKSLNLSFALV